MRNKYTSVDANRSTSQGCFYLVGWLAGTFFLSFWTDRNLDFWLTHLKGETVDCPFWLSFLASGFLPVGLFANLMGEIARLVV